MIWRMAKSRTAHGAAVAALIRAEEREAYQARVAALVSRNKILQIIETARAAEGISKATLAHRAGLEPSSVRRMLTAKTANPTSEHVFRLLVAARIRIDAKLPTGAHVAIA
jgi:ribosome-binding protein aMBF1 (putative translation factor)